MSVFPDKCGIRAECTEISPKRLTDFSLMLAGYSPGVNYNRLEELYGSCHGGNCVYCLSRISRNICRTMVCLEQLRQNGVTVYSPLEEALSFSFQKTMQYVISHSGFQQKSEEEGERKKKYM